MYMTKNMKTKIFILLSSIMTGRIYRACVQSVLTWVMKAENLHSSERTKPRLSGLTDAPGQSNLRVGNGMHW